MSLAALFVLCRFVHFAAVMLMFGTSLFTALLSPQRLSPYLSRDVRPLLISSTWIAGFSAVALLAIQAGQMGDGWADTGQLEIWWAVLGTTFGEVWRWHLGMSLLAGSIEPVVAGSTPHAAFGAAFHVAAGQHGVYRPCGDAWGNTRRAAPF
jgi:Putative copper export protein